MASQINITFKNNKLEEELYTWLKSKLNTGAYIKEVLYNKYLDETQESPQVNVSVQQQPVTAGDNVNTEALDEINFNDVEF